METALTVAGDARVADPAADAEVDSARGEWCVGERQQHVHASGGVLCVRG